MFAEQAFEVKDPAVTPPREDGDMTTPMTTPLHFTPSTTRLPEAVYRRRRLTATAVAAAFAVALLVVARPEQVPLGEADPWAPPGTVEPAAQQVAHSGGSTG